MKYELNSTPELLKTVTSPNGKPFYCIRMSSDLKTIAVAQSTSILFYNVDGKLIETLEDVHSSLILNLDFSQDSKLLASVADKSVLLWKNPNV